MVIVRCDQYEKKNHGHFLNTCTPSLSKQILFKQDPLNTSPFTAQVLTERRQLAPFPFRPLRPQTLNLVTIRCPDP